MCSEGAERRGKTGNVKPAYGLGIEAEIASRQLERIARPAVGGEPPEKNGKN